MGLLKGSPFLCTQYRIAFDKLAAVHSLLRGQHILLEFSTYSSFQRNYNCRAFATVVVHQKLNAARLNSSESKSFDSKPWLSLVNSQNNWASRTRKLWTTAPVQMGRRSSKIAMRKGAQDAKKAKLYGRIGKEIVSAVRKGGSPNPVANSALAALLQYAKDYDIPKEIIERNIKKASEKGQQDYEPVIYEAYGFGGVGIIIEVLTDNSNRAAANVRDVVKKSGCKMADPGSVLFNFRKAGVISIKSEKVDGDSLLVAAMDAGAEDVVEPAHDEDEDPIDAPEKYYKVITPLEQYASVCKRLQEAGMPVDLDCSGLEYIPNASYEPDDEAMDLNKVLMEKLLELDDVDAVYSNQA
ncbi:hypothetical protein KP509_34G026200 [Ceratopteris richardii]|uniref:Transcriptional regulatory protein n=1 Tax=Ceratopteris richardii TaxID=49495 RepID=A0A8T2QJL8_CERRI|nr:hypothetical protein KP509_34G026200 [Ceratopteris richardii]KAH7283839.1 hypothetical protein KP509_34G026200 [Ceratopteris richardii]